MRRWASAARDQAFCAFEAFQPMFAESPDYLVFLVLGARFHDRADDLQVPVEEIFQLQRHVAASAQDTDLDKPPALGQRRDVACEIGFADEVDDHIDTLAIALASDELSEVLTFVVDGEVGAQVLDARQLA